jgi:protein SCO1/2
MNNTPVIATHKIIVFIVFVCAALISSLFIYHASQKNIKPVLAADVGLIFPVPRDIKSFELAAANQQKFTEKDFYKHWTLLFFGFTHCASVCPTTLTLMDHVYKNLHDKYPELRVVLVSVDPERDTPESLLQYAQGFNPDFIAISGKIQNIRKLQSQLGVYSARDNTFADNYQIQHTSSIMLINPEGKWTAIFKYGLKPADLIKGIETSIGYSHG